MKIKILIILCFTILYSNAQFVISAGVSGNAGHAPIVLTTNQTDIYLSGKNSKAFNSKQISGLIDFSFNQSVAINFQYGFCNQKFALKSDSSYYYYSNIFKPNVELKDISSFAGISINKYFKVNDLFLWTIQLGIQKNFYAENNQNYFEIKGDTLYRIESKFENAYSYTGNIAAGFKITTSRQSAFSFLIGYRYNPKPVSYHQFIFPSTNSAYSAIVQNKGQNFGITATIYIPIYKTSRKISLKNTEPIQIQNDNNQISLNGRPGKIQNTILIKSKQIELQIWDHGDVDGDKISVVFNNQIILERFKISHKKKIIPVYLNDGDNFLTIYAHNLGKEPPNTVAVKIIDGNTEQNLNISSTLGECGAIKLVYIP